MMISIDYRKCFNTISTNSAERAVYRAVQDFKAALRWVHANAQTLGVDTHLIFGGGNSSGSIMAIFSAYAEEADRVQVPATYNNPDLGCLNCSGNSLPGDFIPKALINNWGATLDLNIIEPGEAPMISFHGDQDNAVPINFGPAFNFPIFPAMYGSAPITARLDSVGIENEFHIFQGIGHEPWLVNPNFVDTIEERSASFLFRLFLKPDTPSVNGPVEVCMGDTTTYVITGQLEKNYCWNVAGGTIVNAAGDGSYISVDWAAAGNGQLSVRALNDWDGLSDALQMAIIIKNYPVANAGSHQTICAGEPAFLSASGSLFYSWNPPQDLSNPNIANPIATPSNSTIYTVEVSNGTCSSFDSVTVTVPPALSTTLSATPDSCPGNNNGAIDLTVSGGTPAYGYSWSDSSITEDISGLSAGMYSVIVTDDNSCTVTDSMNVPFANPTGPPGVWTWTGIVDSNWFEPCNWDKFVIPDNLSNVLVPGTTPYQPYIGVDTGYCKHITIMTNPAGGRLFIDAFSGGKLIKNP